MDLTRRWFLCGTVATLAAVTVPVTVQATKIIARPFKFKRVIDIEMYPPDGGYIDVTVGKNTMMRQGIGSGGWLRWRGHPGNEIIVPEDHFIKFDHRPLDLKMIGYEGMKEEPVIIHMIYQDFDGHDWGKVMLEQHTITRNITLIEPPVNLQI